MSNDYNNREEKCLNNSYNISYNWINLLLLRRKVISITYSAHAIERNEFWNLNLDKVEKTIRIGRIDYEKSKRPEKVCFKRYYGKENITYVVITRFYSEHIEVKTLWAIKGR
jgi:hypothetical protein